MRTRRPGFVGFVLLILGAATAGAQMEVDTARSLEVTLELYSSRDAFVLLRSIAGAREVEILGEHSIRVTGTPELLDTVSRVLASAEHPGDLASELRPVELSDGSVVASVRMPDGSLGEATRGMRAKLGIARSFRSTSSSRSMP